MSQPLGKKPRPKQPKKPPRPRWIDICPVCMREGKVRTVTGCKVEGRGRFYRWACEACVKERCLVLATTRFPDALPGGLNG